ncbi:MAG TPA: hypothetical protein ENN42_04515 [Thioalkalivibrio sp.]|nr:hypothetical protein [Thioalkalivibrio sp.]
MRFKKSTLALGVGVALVATTAYALTQLAVNDPIVLSTEAGGALGNGANKSKLFRHRDGTLLTVYGDYVDDTKLVYDLKGQYERPARDLFVRTCDSIANSCMEDTHWSPPVNISGHAELSSIDADWDGDGALEPFWGDAEKPNGFINPNGVTVVSWVSHYCPGGDQRARLYIERDSRVIPFTCTWVNYSTDRGTTWEGPIQLSSGERAAKQDVNRGTANWWAVTWQEDPTGLELGEAEGPGDGASGANVSGGTDIWYSYTDGANDASISEPLPTNGWVFSPPVRLTDNVDGTGTPGSLDIVFDDAGNPVPQGSIEKGSAGASRANLGAVGNTVISAWEETKGSGGLDEGKFIRYLNFPVNAAPEISAGCIISDPEKNARRVRFVTQAPNSGPGDMRLGIFWKEGINTQGGPSDIRFRYATGGVAPANMTPAVSPDCATSVYEETQALVDHEQGYNVSSRTKDVASSGVDNLADDTELQFTENALAHRGLLRGDDLWLGYSYTENLALLTYLNEDNYNFWIRKFNVTNGWSRPQQVSNETNTEVNVREPRLVGTQPDGDFCNTVAEECRNTETFYVAWGTQTNVSPWAPEAPAELGLFITRSTDAGASYEPVVQLSVAQGVASGLPFDDEEETASAFESQIQVRPDGEKFYAVWNQTDETGTYNEFTTGAPEEVAGPALTGGSSSGCSIGNGTSGSDPLLPGLALAALAWLGLRRRLGVTRG